jgi:hypothetical protein
VFVNKRIRKPSDEDELGFGAQILLDACIRKAVHMFLLNFNCLLLRIPVCMSFGDGTCGSEIFM